VAIRLVPTVSPGDAPEAAQDVEALTSAAGGVERPVARAACGTDAVPGAWLAELAAAGEVWVPGEFSRAALERSGADPRALRVVPPVVDTEAFTPDAPERRPPDARGHVLLAVVDWVRASGWDVLLRAYAREFAAAEDVTLVLRAWSSLGYTPHVVGEMVVADLEADGHDLDHMPDLILEMSDAHARPEPADYRGADCLVAPARADAWGRRPLEAMACGVPVIATSWGAGATVLPPDTALALPVAAAAIPDLAAREIPQLAAGRWGEPDLGALRRLLRASFAGEPEVAAAASAGRAYVLEHHAADRFSPPREDRRRPPPQVRRPQRGCRSQDVSFVLQGPVERTGRGRTAFACAAIRTHFPGAEIVASTWAGTDVSGLDADVVVHSEDPGPVGSSTFNANTNRQIVGSLAGVRAASRPLVAKVRSDLLFVSDVLLDHWGRWEERGDELRVFERRVLAPDVFTRRPSYVSPYPLHPSDWAYFGLRSDLETLFDAPLMGPESTVVPGPLTDDLGRLYYPKDPVPAYTPEQWIWAQAMRRADPDVALAHVYDVNPASLRLTEVSLANNLAVLDTYLQFGVWCPKYPWANRRFADFTLLQHAHWRELYDLHCRGRRDPRPDALLTRLAAGDLDASAEDALTLLRAGLSWEAQLLECVLAGPRLWRDTTTGGPARWAFDQQVLALAREHLRAAAARA
jgi:hypothetical protein